MSTSEAGRWPIMFDIKAGKSKQLPSWWSISCRWPPQGGTQKVTHCLHDRGPVRGGGWDGTAVLCCSFHPRLVQCPPPAGLGRLVQGPPPRLVQDPPQAAERGQLLGGSVQGPPPRSATAASGIRCAQALGGGPGRGGRLDVRLRGRFRVRTRYGPSFAQQVPAAVPVSAGRGTPRTALAPGWGRSAFIGSLRRVREKGS